jgi:hypothetical protein
MDGGGGRLPVDGNCGRPPADGAAVRLRRTALEDGPGGRRTSVGSSDASGRPADAAVDIRTRDNPGCNVTAKTLTTTRLPIGRTWMLTSALHRVCRL